MTFDINRRGKKTFKEKIAQVHNITFYASVILKYI